MARQMAMRLHSEPLIVDNFAGGGGASLGIEWALGRSPDIAVNHDPEAIAMHAENHPSTRHLCESVWEVDPLEVTGGRPVAVAWFSPDCTFFSKSRGARPLRSKERKVRALAWIVVRWAKAVRPRVIFLENVEEFEDWGPVDRETERPDPERRGVTFRHWVARLRNLGYQVEWRELRASDFGAPTSRKRLFLIARCDGEAIVWPQPTHGPGRAEPHRTAAECIEWSEPCWSIFLTPAEVRELGLKIKRPLADATMRRIARGTFKYVIDAAEPFVVPYYGERRGSERSRARSIREPIATIPTANRFAIVAPTLIQTSWGERPGQAPRVPGLDKPLGTIMAGGAKHGLVAAFLAKHYSERPTGGWPGGASLGAPLSTVTVRDHHALVASSIVKLKGTSRDGQPVTTPLHTIQAKGNHYAEVRAFLTKYYGTRACGSDLRDPMHTVTANDRFGLVTVSGEDYDIADIGMRILIPRELYRGQGFPDSYRIDFSIGPKPLSEKAQTRMCGNSVSPYVAAALVRANVGVQREREVAA